MSGAKWCDVGGHAFSANEANAQQLSVTRQTRNEWGGQQPFTVQQDICAECAASMGLIDIGVELENVTTKNEDRRALHSRLGK